MKDDASRRTDTLTRIAEVLGPMYGSERLAPFLYAHLRMRAPRTVVELGTGVGVSSFWMAKALEDNGHGHLWTIDSFDALRDPVELRALRDLLGACGLTDVVGADAPALLREVAERLGLSSRMSIIPSRLNLDQDGHFARYDFSSKTLDFVFSDFLHGPDHIERILGHFLPRMSDAAAILIDSVASEVASYLAVERFVADLNSGRTPPSLSRGWLPGDHDAVSARTYRLLHLRDQTGGPQRTTTWIDIEPRRPWPSDAALGDHLPR
ncbi:class I SAM-dependent methyltransferase [Microbacterium sp. NPDC019599]|uniref:class I SAM-dependent methyltransferase n=1 Tax=Microbacterium sp. NPDC019599 TaxID=3154690 RepID=UPI0033D29639